MTLATPTELPLRRVVVTGSAGFIGSHLARALVAAGVTVIGVDRRGQGSDSTAADNLAELAGSPAFVPIQADLLRCPLDALLIDADAVFHMAAQPGVQPSWNPDFETYTSDNIHVVQRVMDSAIRLRIPRVVLASSSSVYGETDGSPSSETDPLRPRSPYAVTKLAAEQLALAHASRTDSATSLVALRYFTVYGARQRPDMLIHRVLSAALDRTPLRIYGNGDQQRDFTHVDDVVQATLAAATAATVTNAVINVGAGASTSVSEILTVTEKITGRPVTTERCRERPGDVRVTCADTTKARRLLGWKPEVDLVSGMDQQLRDLQSRRRQTNSV